MVVFEVKFHFTFDIFSHLTQISLHFVAAKTGPNTGFYGDKILHKNLDLTQDFPNKILFHFLKERSKQENKLQHFFHS